MDTNALERLEAQEKAQEAWAQSVVEGMARLEAKLAVVEGRNDVLMARMDSRLERQGARDRGWESDVGALQRRLSDLERQAEARMAALEYLLRDIGSPGLAVRLGVLEQQFQTWFDAFAHPDAATRDIRMETAVISVVSVAEQRVAAMHKEGTEDRNALRGLITMMENMCNAQDAEVQKRLDHLDTNFDSVARAAVRRALKDMSNDR